jgi:PKD domain-containing protein
MCLSGLLIVPMNVSHALAGECGAEIIADLVGSGDEVQVSATGKAGCNKRIDSAASTLTPYFTHEIACSPDRLAAAEGLCSATPCSDSGRFFAFRTIHRPDGSSGPAGFSCVSLEQAVAAPGVNLAEVFAAVRRVKLPGGEIGVEPELRGLANLESYFWVEGANQPPVELQVGGSTVRAEFRVVEYRWTFGSGQTLVTEGPGTPGLESEVNATFPRRGMYRVGVTVMWAAEAFLDGRRVGEVGDLVSRAGTTYPVAELRTVLTG